MNFDQVNLLAVMTADAQESIFLRKHHAINKLVNLRSEVEIWKSLLESFLALYGAAA
jgi:hypothetical protein